MVAFGAVKKKTFELIETGEYVFTLQDVGEITGDYGDRMQWDFLLAPKDDPTAYISRNDGAERVLRFWTDTDIIIGSRQHEWLQALTGRNFGEGDELPDGDEILSKRMVGYLTHYAPKKGKNAGVLREDLVAGSVKPFAVGGKKASNGTAKAAAPAAPPVDDDERPALIAEIKKQIRRAALADVDSETVALWKEINLDSMETSELRDGLQSMKDAIEASIEA